MKVYVDIDETICEYPNERKYELAEPIPERIAQINKLYDAGHEIYYWTARGTTTGIDWEDLTKKQFERWGVKYHGLFLKKPQYDIFIDDKSIQSERFFKTMLDNTPAVIRNPKSVFDAENK